MAITTINLNEIDFDHNNITFVDDLTLETVKIKYGWLLNAKVKDAIVGQDTNGLVWYFGEWLCGEWYDGTWYSGIWRNGTWRNGQWYAYEMDKFQVLSNNARILSTNNTKSIFMNGFWENGTFNSGIFGINNSEDWEEYELSTESRPEPNGQYPIFRKQYDTGDGSISYIRKDVATWLDGIFVSGEIYDTIWMDGTVRNTTAKNIQWVSGKWFNGTFDGNTWYDGTWYNGNFINGTWKNGLFNHLNKDIPSRFGNTLLSGETICVWENGHWKNGEFFSGIVKNTNGDIIPSIYNNISIWENGLWENGKWYGGHFKNGEWKNGIWYNGVFGNITFSDWYEPNSVYQLNDGDNCNWNKHYEGNFSLTRSTNSIVDIKDEIISGITGVDLIKYDSYSEPPYVYAKNEYMNIIDDYIKTYDFITNTHIEFNGNLVSLLTHTYPSMKYDVSVGDTIYINYGTKTITTTVLNITSNKIYINTLIDKDIQSGNLYTDESWNEIKKTNTIKFGSFGIDPDLLDMRIVNGYQISYDTKIYNLDYDYNTVNINNLGTIYDDIVSIQINKFTDGFWYEILNYDQNFFAENGDTLGENPYTGTEILPDVSEGKKSNLPINTLQYKNKILGDIGDMWTLNNLNKYVDKIKYVLDNEYIVEDEYRENLINIVEKDFGDLENIMFDNGDLTVSFKFKYEATNKLYMMLSNVKIRAILTSQNTPTWQNGTWNKGTWLNGIFNNGKFLSGIWLSGSFNDGQMGGN